jgi:hypothetical protein
VRVDEGDYQSFDPGGTLGEFVERHALHAA